MGRIGSKADDEAEQDLLEAGKLVDDAGVKKALADLQARKAARREKEKKAYAKMFG